MYSTRMKCRVYSKFTVLVKYVILQYSSSSAYSTIAEVRTDMVFVRRVLSARLRRVRCSSCAEAHVLRRLYLERGAVLGGEHEVAGARVESDEVGPPAAHAQRGHDAREVRRVHAHGVRVRDGRQHDVRVEAHRERAHRVEEQAHVLAQSGDRLHAQHSNRRTLSASFVLQSNVFELWLAGIVRIRGNVLYCMVLYT